MYKAVIFDFFGVFCPDITMDWLKRTVPDHESILPAFHTICSKSDHGLLDKAGFYQELSALTHIPAEEITQGVEGNVAINDSLVEWTKQLRARGYKTACLSNGTQEWTLSLITTHGLAELFDEIVLSSDLQIAKPDPRIFKHALEKLGVRASDTVFVDDRQGHVDAAQSQGITGILFTNTDQFIADFPDIPCDND